ncbi:MAG: FAD binding domain-containing protein [Acidobacteriota bacterium]
MEINFILNNEDKCIEVDPMFPVLRLLRETMGISSVKTGCGEGECGACTVILGTPENGIIRYKNVATCIMPAGKLNGKHLVTVEGINGDKLSPVQKTLVDEGAVQCGFCTPGFVMSLTGFFLGGEKLSYKNILNAIDGNICRCTGYFPIKRTAKKLLESVSEYPDTEERIKKLVELSFIPRYFLTIRDRLVELKEKILTDKSIKNEINEKMIFVGGGTDLLVEKSGRTGADYTRFISNMAGNINLISKKDEFIRIGAGVSVTDIKDSEVIREHIPGIENFMEQVSSGIIRNMATLGGNIVNASPIGDLSVLFLALDSSLVLSKDGVTREIKLKDFFRGYKVLDLKDGELIEFLKFPSYDNNVYINFEKVSKRNYLDIAACNSAILIRNENRKIKKCMISAGGVSPVPLYLQKSSEFITGKEITIENLKELSKITLTEISPISDVRGSAEYKKELLNRLILSHFILLFPDLVNEGDLI